MNTPLIKWTGSKRPIAAKITSYFPKEIETYYEPFQILRQESGKKRIENITTNNKENKR